MKTHSYILLIVLLTLNFSCNAQKQKANKHKSSLSIVNDVIVEPINKYIKDDIKNNIFMDVIIVKLDFVKNNEYDIYIKGSNLRTEQNIVKYNLSKDKPKGSLYINNKLILVYGDINLFFKEIASNIDILENLEPDIEAITVHSSYKHYKYKKNEIYGEVEESIELVGELDTIEDK